MGLEHMKKTVLVCNPKEHYDTYLWTFLKWIQFSGVQGIVSFEYHIRLLYKITSALGSS